MKAREEREKRIVSDTQYREILNRYNGLIQSSARAFLYMKCVPVIFDIEDFVQEGRLALLWTMERQDPDGKSFEPYFKDRLWGSFRDLMRQGDFLSRDDRNMMQKYSRWREKNPFASMKEAALAIGITLEDLFRLLRDGYCTDADSSGSGIDIPSVLPSSELTEIISFIEAAERSIPQNRLEQVMEIVRLYFLSPLDLKQSGEKMEIGEGRAAQIAGEFKDALLRAIAA